MRLSQVYRQRKFREMLQKTPFRHRKRSFTLAARDDVALIVY